MSSGNRERAEALCAALPDATRARAVELAENVLWMEGKLAEARKAIGKSSVAIPYDNGGGQRGIRKNPAFDGYNSLMAQYVRALNQLCQMLGDTGGSKQASTTLNDLRKAVVKIKTG